MTPARGVLIAASAAALMGLGGCTSLAPTEDPMYLRLTDIEARLVRMERVFENESLVQMANQIDALRAETRELRGEVETLRHETENASNRQRDLYLDVDRRLQSLEGGRAPLAGGPGMGAGQQGPFPLVEGADAAGAGAGGAFAGGALNDQEAYQAAFGMLQARRYEEASNAFNQFLTAFPDSALADNAQYWLAETYYVRREFDAALPEFEKVLELYPQSDKTADALLKVGYCNHELRQWDAARSALRRVMREYPDTTAARLASQRLDLIAQEAG